jgi:GTPase SAR1 family protein
VKTKWVPEIRHHCPEVPFLLVGTKMDLRSNMDTLKELEEQGLAPVKTEQGNTVAKEVGAIEYLECSAMEQESLKNVFDQAIRSVLSIQRRRIVGGPHWRLCPLI